MTESAIPRVRLRAFITENLQGKCKILSEGDGCTCALCDLDRIVEALHWYEMEAVAIQKNTDGNVHALTASLHVLSLDGGRRSKVVIGEPPTQPACTRTQQCMAWSHRCSNSPDGPGSTRYTYLDSCPQCGQSRPDLSPGEHP